MFSKAACDCFPLKSDFSPANNQLSFTRQCNSLLLFASQILKIPGVFHLPTDRCRVQGRGAGPGAAAGLGARGCCRPGAREPRPLLGEPNHPRAHAPLHTHNAVPELFSKAASIPLGFTPGMQAAMPRHARKPAPGPLKAISFSIAHPEQNSTSIFLYFQCNFN